MSDTTRTPSRAELIEDVLDEMATFNPASLMRAWQHWPRGRLSLIHLNVLAVLDSHGPLAMGELAEALDVSQASATGIVDRMEQRGVLARSRATSDRRVIHVTITDAGRDTLAGIAFDRRERLARMLDLLSDAELAGFLLGSRAMRRIREQHVAESLSAAPELAKGLQSAALPAAVPTPLPATPLPAVPLTAGAAPRHPHPTPETSR